MKIHIEYEVYFDCLCWPIRISSIYFCLLLGDCWNCQRKIKRDSSRSVYLMRLVGFSYKTQLAIFGLPQRWHRGILLWQP